MTAKFHVGNVLGKLSVPSRSKAMPRVTTLAQCTKGEATYLLSPKHTPSLRKPALPTPDLSGKALDMTLAIDIGARFRVETIPSLEKGAQRLLGVRSIAYSVATCLSLN